MALSREIAALGELPVDALRTAWQVHYGATPPKRVGRDLLIRAVAYRLQEKALVGLKPATQRRLKRLAEELRTKGEVSTVARPAVKPGTRLIREWHGTTHEVWVLDEGYLWRGERYRSLSEIARSITGTRWSGPAFFGLNAKGRSAHG